MTTSQPPTCYCCLRSRGENLSACALSQLSVRTPALLCIRDYRSDLGPELPWCSALLKLLTAEFTSTDTLGCYGFYFIFFILFLLDQKSPALQWGWRRFDCRFLGHLLRLHRWLPLGFSSTAHTPEGQRSARWNHKKRHGMWKLV